jgi:uncharacterized protein (DUF1684 family)
MQSTIIIFLTILSVELYGQEQLTETAHRAEVDRWHAGRINGLKKDHGWLSLVALDWLKEGKNEIPAIGTITTGAKGVTVSVNRESQGMMNGKPFVSGAVVPDKDKIQIGTKALQIIERGGKFAVRVWDSEAPARKKFTGIERYPVTAEWKITARWEPYAQGKKIEIPTVIPGLMQQGIVPGAAIFSIDGKEYRLEPTKEEGEDQLFFVFGDKTNGKETYGAGRFLYAGPPVNNTIVLDFNRAYNPPCVFTDYATCPVPTKENRLPVRIEAGEKNFKH